MRRFVTSDSHGGYKALVQCLERCGFDKEQDQLFFVGDVVDGWPETKESIALLLSLRHLVYLLGNHDQWTRDFYTGKLEGNSAELEAWLSQGGAATVQSYGIGRDMPAQHLELLQKAQLYHVTDDRVLMVHAGFDPAGPLEESSEETLLWSRDFVSACYELHRQKQAIKVEHYKEVIIGHTPVFTFNRNQTLPLKMGNVTLLDTGAAFTGCLSIMDLDSGQVWQSDRVITLYPDHKGRNPLSFRDMQGLGLDPADLV
ncbi:MAG: metallophosphoesterase [Hymenobacteraceae bacterium]|nr:metallophosphoesterase [Hymenobacteraceae bacterium]MDX5482692.1 metallophosphoesterase [Hymenobacteraceae bacterium]